MTRAQIRYRVSPRRAEMRTFSVEGMTRWLIRNGIPYSVTVLADGTRRVVCAPRLPVDRLALARYGFSHSVKECLFYRNEDPR
jgi:hypothetical protein